MFNFLRKPPFGLDISDYSVEVVSLEGSFERPKLSAMGRIILEPGVVENGEVLKEKELEKSLRSLFENLKIGKLRTRRFVFSFPEAKSFVHIANLPDNLRKKEEVSYVKSQASQIFPFSISELFLDYKIERRDDSKEIILAAARKDIVNKFLDVFKDLKLQPICLEMESESLGRSLVDTPEPILIVDIGARTTNFSFFIKKELRFTHIYKIAGNEISKSLAKVLRISFKEAESLKKEVGLNPEIKEGKVFLILQKEIQKIIREITKIENFFRERENKEIQKVILVGGSAMLPHLPEYLAQNIEKPVIIGDPWIRINIDILKKKEYFKKALEISPILYATCIGSALRGLVKKPRATGINLIK